MEPKKLANQDELSLVDILLFLSNTAKYMMIGTLLSLTVGISGYLYFPATYEATANIQMAFVSGKPIESPEILLEKIKLPLYFSGNIWQICNISENESQSKKIINHFKPVLNKSAPFITLTVKAESTQRARDCLNAILNEIKEHQSEIAKPVIEQKNVQLQELIDRLKLAEDAYKILASRSTSSNAFHDTQSIGNSVVLSTTVFNSWEIKNLKTEINNLKISLLEPQTKPTNLITSIYVSDVPTNKNIITLSMICIILGIFIGIMSRIIVIKGSIIFQQLKDAKNAL